VVSIISIGSIAIIKPEKAEKGTQLFIGEEIASSPLSALFRPKPLPSSKEIMMRLLCNLLTAVAMAATWMTMPASIQDARGQGSQPGFVDVYYVHYRPLHSDFGWMTGGPYDSSEVASAIAADLRTRGYEVSVQHTDGPPSPPTPGGGAPGT
jgi:hypothetical protein